jgi:RNA polymerase sigma-70 factor (ECF subfamily)
VSEIQPDIERLQAFDDQAWLAVEREYAGRLLAYIARRVRDVEAREDVLQETLLGAVRGIATYDPLYTFEQYLFGICHNRTIDHLRRRRLRTVDAGEEDASKSGLDALARNVETPSRIVRGADLEREAQRLLGQLLRQWVQETWEAGEFRRLMVIEALFSGGWRNKDTWERFELRDETAVAGIKFRAIARLRELALSDPGSSGLYALLSQAGEARLDFGVSEVWRAQRVSCPARHWLARWAQGSLAEGPRSFLEFHVEEMECDFCRANLEDLKGASGSAAQVSELLERVGESTLRYLHSRSRP